MAKSNSIMAVCLLSLLLLAVFAKPAVAEDPKDANSKSPEKSPDQDSADAGGEPDVDDAVASLIQHPIVIGH
ncbi:hypothetical protein H6P81_008028 [Aristolochia fimbriata]|uniref:Uncharacterized protein n=1 Tax=Aristolochia fimbriata TaxID=158543 RepID=A0AAV7F387_ARIFI|nr:hypothetical protein H6P81_008028 [Aristolochia fimbriata]